MSCRIYSDWGWNISTIFMAIWPVCTICFSGKTCCLSTCKHLADIFFHKKIYPSFMITCKITLYFYSLKTADMFVLIVWHSFQQHNILSIYFAEHLPFTLQITNGACTNVKLTSNGLWIKNLQKLYKSYKWRLTGTNDYMQCSKTE